jgi:NAD(P)H-quinone oxidoreductase subunit 6
VNLAEGVQVVSVGILSLMMIGSALGVVLLENIVYSAFLLGGVLISIAGLYLLLNADFVAAAQVLIYVGAVNVLILFAIMLVNKQETYTPVTRRWVRRAATALVCLGLFALLSGSILQTPWAISTDRTVPFSSAVAIGEHFFSDFLLPFELASVLLLMALIGAVVLARREYLPEEEAIAEAQVMQTLPERPRETIALSGSSSSSPESTVESVEITSRRK